PAAVAAAPPPGGRSDRPRPRARAHRRSAESTGLGDRMRRCAILLVAFAAAGCGSLKDAFSTHPAAAARAGDQTLTVERLAELAARVKQMPLQTDNLTRLADVWIDYALFGQALAAGWVEKASLERESGG